MDISRGGAKESGPPCRLGRSSLFWRERKMPELKWLAYPLSYARGNTDARQLSTRLLARAAPKVSLVLPRQRVKQ